MTEEMGQLPYGLMLAGTPGAVTCGWCDPPKSVATHTFLYLHPWGAGAYLFFCDQHARDFARRFDVAEFRLAVPAEWSEDWRTEVEGSETKHEG